MCSYKLMDTFVSKYEALSIKIYPNNSKDIEELYLKPTKVFIKDS